MEYSFVDPETPEEEVLPRKLYKYFGNIEYVNKALENGLYLDNPENFNDPFDEAYKVYHVGSDKYKTWETFKEIFDYFLSDQYYIENYWGKIDFEKVKETIFNMDLDWLIKIDEAVDIFLEVSHFYEIPREKIINYIRLIRSKPSFNYIDTQLKIACFSSTNLSVPMWAYYGKSHTGFCVEYDMNLLPYNIKKHIHCMHYKIDRDNSKVHFAKSNEWKHEREWRIILNFYNGTFLPFDCISAIYLGERNDLSVNPCVKTKWFDPETFNKKDYTGYIRLIDNIKKSNHPISLYKAETDYNEYKINFTKFYEHKGVTK